MNIPALAQAPHPIGSQINRYITHCIHHYVPPEIRSIYILTMLAESSVVSGDNSSLIQLLLRFILMFVWVFCNYSTTKLFIMVQKKDELFTLPSGLLGLPFFSIQFYSEVSKIFGHFLLEQRKNMGVINKVSHKEPCRQSLSDSTNSMHWNGVGLA